MLCLVEALELRFVTSGTCLGTDIIVIDNRCFADKISSSVRAFGYCAERQPNRQCE